MHINKSHALVPGSVASLAHAFADTLDADRRADLFQPYTAATAANGSNFPQGYLGARGTCGSTAPGCGSSSRCTTGSSWPTRIRTRCGVTA